MRSMLSRLAIGLALMLGLMTLGAFQAPQQASAAANTAKITLHVIECPATTTTLFASCHDTNRLSGVGFTVAGVSRHTDTNGVVSWGPSAGSQYVHEFSTVFSAYGVAYVYCTDQTTLDVLFAGKTFTGNIRITTTAGHLTICDWYNLT